VRRVESLRINVRPNWRQHDALTGDNVVLLGLSSAGRGANVVEKLLLVAQRFGVRAAESAPSEDLSVARATHEERLAVDVVDEVEFAERHVPCRPGTLAAGIEEDERPFARPVHR